MSMVVISSPCLDLIPYGHESMTEHQALGTAEVNDGWGDEKGKKMTKLTLSFPFIVKKTPHSLHM